MGLDMYLYANDYISGWSHSKIEAQERFRAVAGALGIKPEWVAEGSPHIDVKIAVAYWRKANAIHAWFVDNVQDGKDECQEAYVSKHDLEMLHAKCKFALETRNPNILPPRSGFFFGSTDVNQYYWSDLEDTVKMLDKILTNPRWDESSFYYQSSW